MLYLFVHTQFRTQNRFALLLELLVLGDDPVTVDNRLIAGIDRIDAEATDDDGKQHGEAENRGTHGQALGLWADWLLKAPRLRLCFGAAAALKPPRFYSATMPAAKGVFGLSRGDFPGVTILPRPAGVPFRTL
jgi:hypothetical protein